MNDVFIFAMGCAVSLFVLSAVSLLLWGAANEPRGEFFGSAGDSEPRAKPRDLAPAGELKSPA